MSEKWNLLCAMFGHRPEGPGWWGDVPYCRPSIQGTDGVGRIHGALYHECRRCGTMYLAVRFHVNDERITAAIAKATGEAS